MKNTGFSTEKAMLKAQTTTLVPLQRKVQIQHSGKGFETVTVTLKLFYKEEKRFIIREAAIGVTSFVHLC